MAERKEDTYVYHNGAISAPKIHSPAQFDPQTVRKVFPSAFANQPPSIDIVLSSSQSKPISVAQMEDIVKGFVLQQRQKELDKAKFGALRDERDLYKTQVIDTTKAKENLRQEIGVLKERTFIMNQTMNERENAMRELQDMSRYVQSIEEQKVMNQNQLMEAERRNQDLKRQLAEKKARDEAMMRNSQSPQYQVIQQYQPQPLPMNPVPVPINMNQGVTRITSNPNYSQVSPVLSNSIPMMNPMYTNEVRGPPLPAQPARQQGGQGMGTSNDIFDFVQQYNMQNSSQHQFNFAGNNSGIMAGPPIQQPSRTAQQPVTMIRQQQPMMVDPYANPAAQQPGPNAVFNPLMKQPNF